MIKPVNVCIPWLAQTGTYNFKGMQMYKAPNTLHSRQLHKSRKHILKKGNRDQKCKSMQTSWRSKSIEKKLTMEFKEQKVIIEQKLILRHLVHLSGVARPGPTRACALRSTSQALPSPGQQDSRDSSMNTKKQMYTHAWFLQQC